METSISSERSYRMVPAQRIGRSSAGLSCWPRHGSRWPRPAAGIPSCRPIGKRWLRRPDLLSKLRADPYNYFRFINHEWTSRVCEVFAGDLRASRLSSFMVMLTWNSTPSRRAPGDSMISTTPRADRRSSTSSGSWARSIWRSGGADGRAIGPGLRSVRGRLSPGTLRPAASAAQPPIVDRLQLQQSTPTNEAFLAWADTLMEPMSETVTKGVTTAMSVFARIVQQAARSAGCLFPHRTGGMAAHGHRQRNRQEGPDPGRRPVARPEDDVLLEAKAIRALADVRCLETPRSGPTFRVITGNQQLGRLKHDILVAGPEVPIPELTPRAESQRLVDPQLGTLYREIGLDDFGSVEELATLSTTQARNSGPAAFICPGSGGRRPAAAVAGLARQVRRPPRR